MGPVQQVMFLGGGNRYSCSGGQVATGETGGASVFIREVVGAETLHQGGPGVADREAPACELCSAPGRCFSRHLYAATVVARKKSAVMRVNRSVWAYIRWWYTFAQDWNGTSLMWSCGKQTVVRRCGLMPRGGVTELVGILSG